MTESLFALPDSPKADPALIERDQEHFAAIATAVDSQIRDLTRRRDETRRVRTASGQSALERDLETHRITARLRLLERYGSDVVLGHMQLVDQPYATYIGRVGIADADGTQLLIDWRAPAAEPFFSATHAHPMGLAYRRRYRWAGGRIVDYWDEVFTDADGDHRHALDDQSAFVASLGSARTGAMRDVLATIQSDQDAIIRADSAGPLVVDGGPGTGKTVVALHRAAYLLYADPRLGARRGGLLIVGPHRPYLNYVADVLPSLGEEDVQTCTIADMIEESAGARHETDPIAARLKSSARMIEVVEPAVRLYEDPPITPTLVETPWRDAAITPADWARIFAAREPGIAHNEAQDQIWQALIDVVHGKIDDDVPRDALARALAQNRALRRQLHSIWPILDATDLVADLWAVPAYLKMCAPWLSAEDRASLRRAEGSPWTIEDLPILDAMRGRLGDLSATASRRARESAVAERREYMDDVVQNLIAADDDGEGIVTSLVQSDLREVLDDDEYGAPGSTGGLDGPFAHIIVDEAQELTDAEWSMILRRCPSRSLTIVGDRAQARRGFAETWSQRLTRAGVPTPRISSLTVNYRTPSEVMEAAEPVIRAAIPDANVPTSVRSSGVPVRFGAADELDAIVSEWEARTPEGTGCVIGSHSFSGTERVRSLPPEEAKGLEFDLVVLANPGSFGDGIAGSVDRYVAMTRATQELVILTS